MEDKEIANLIRESRIVLGYTQEQVSELSKISFGEYQRIEYSKRSLRKVSMEHGLALCRLLELDPYELLKK